MHKQVFGSLVAVAIAISLVGCSNSSGSRTNSTATVNVEVGQEDVRDAQVWVVAVTEGGQLTEDVDGRFVRSEYELDDNSSQTRPTVFTEEVQMFMLVPRIADTDTDLNASTRTCQWVAGCEEAGVGTAFGERFEQIDRWFWRSVTYGLSSDERIRITPLTHLAASLAYHRQYVESTTSWDTTGYYTAYSVEQSVSQLSLMFGIDNVQTTEPADLTLLDSMSGNQTQAMNKIRYGALLAAWRNLSENYTGDEDSLADAVALDLVANDGQLYQAGGDQTISLASLYQVARDNLSAVTVTNTNVSGYVNSVLDELDANIAAFTSGALTTTAPASLESLFGTDDYEDFTLGLQRTKAFVEVLRDYENTFFEDGYRDQLDAYVDMVKSVGDTHEADLNKVIDYFVQTHELYTDCYLNGACGSTSDYSDWLNSVDSYDSGTGILTLNGGDIVVSQEVADVNLTDSDDNPAQSHAIDIKIVGQYVSGDLTFNVDHTYEDDDKDNDIESASGVRVYFTDEVSELVDESGNEIIGYELRWSDFQMYDANNLGTDDELEYDGSFRLFYRGVRDPHNDDSELRFNIDTVGLVSRISDEVSDDDDDDSDFSTLTITASSTNASDFYPEKEFASFNGFFAANNATSFEEGSIQPGLVSYETGTQTIGDETVHYLDIRVPMGESYRYRLYPTQEREDEFDVDSDDDVDELVNVYDTEICDLTGNNSDGWSVSSCSPQQRFYGESDFSDYINSLWRSGTLSRIEIPGRGYYFVEWAASADADSCLVLDDLQDGGDSLDGTLYSPYVLGLNSLRFQSIVDLNDEPDTLLDVLLNAPTTDDYQVTAALSHDYSSTTTNTVTVGNGSDLDRILLNYSTNSAFTTTGSVAVFKDGVSLSLDDGTTDTVDSTLTVYLDKSTNADPLPYEYVINEEGDYERCVTANVAEWDETRDLDSSTLYLNYRDVVYGRVEKENGFWIIRYIDGTFETL